MSAFYNRDERTAIFFGSLPIAAVYKGDVLVWEAVSKIWKGAQLWKGSEAWKY